MELPAPRRRRHPRRTTTTTTTPAPLMLDVVVAMAAAATVLLLAAPAQGQGLFPAVVSNAALRRPVAANVMCSNEPCTGLAANELCTPCNSVCPLSDNPAGLGVRQLTTVPQSKCGCSASNPYAGTLADIGTAGASAPTNCYVAGPPASGGSQLRLNAQAHPPQFVNDGSLATSWQTPRGQHEAELTLDLQIAHEVLSITLTFASLRPKSMYLERSLDGVTFTPWQYFSTDCMGTFGLPADKAPSAPGEVVCVSDQSSASEEDRIVSFATLPAARLASTGGVPYAQSSALQAFVRARYVRLQLREYHELAPSTVTTTPPPFGSGGSGGAGASQFYAYHALAEMRVSGRCFCNGHAGSCLADQCLCSHNTTGTTCDRCLPLFNEQPWAAGVEGGAANACVGCECNGYADACVFDAARDGGVCQACTNNTMGPQCESCVPGYFRDGDVCRPCRCSAAGTLESAALGDGGGDDADGSGDGGDGLTSAAFVCDVHTGQCPCRPNVVGEACDACQPDHYGLEDPSINGCVSCDCETLGTVGGSSTCDLDTGACPCKASHQGRTCSACVGGFYGAPTCNACNPLCSTCSGPGTTKPGACQSCAFFESDGSCVASCPAFHYADTNNVCRECNAQCDGGCRGPGAALAACFACKNVELAGLCTGACPNDMYPDDSNVCRACNEQCAESCSGPGPDNCDQCRNVSLGQTCLGACPVDYYADVSDVCQPCSAQCRDGTFCSGPLASQCLGGCANVALEDGTCVAACPALTYPDMLGVCRPCNSQCAGSCSGPGSDNCETCRNVALGGNCLASCPATHYASGGQCLPCDSRCSGCTGGTNTQCVECASSAFSSVSGAVRSCVLASGCPSQTYANRDSGHCEACADGCKTCSGPLQANCSACLVYAFADLCVSTCPSGTFANELTRTCDACDPLCNGCTGAGPASCRECRFFKHAGVCVAACPDKTFSDGGECRACHPQCATNCLGSLDTQCIIAADETEGNPCTNVLRPDTGRCVSACNPGEYTDAGRVCRTCDSKCTLCFGAGSNQCSKCATGFYLDETTCQACHPQCGEDGSCSGPGSNNCTFGCRNFKDYSLNPSGVCVAACPANTYVSNSPVINSCNACNAECSGGCDGPGANQCTRCKNFIDVDLASADDTVTCVSVCPALQQADASKECKPCDIECAEGCSRPGDPQFCTKCQHYLDIDTCVAECDDTRNFLIPSISGGEATCAAACPSDRPFYNDTRSNPEIPQLCVTSCSEIPVASDGEPRTGRSPVAPLRCTTQAQAELDSAQASSSSDAMGSYGWPVIGAAVGLLIIIIIVVLVVRCRRRQSADVVSFEQNTDSAGGPPLRRSMANGAYAPGKEMTGYNQSRNSLNSTAMELWGGSGQDYIDSSVFDPAGVHPQNNGYGGGYEGTYDDVGGMGLSNFYGPTDLESISEISAGEAAYMEVTTIEPDGMTTRM